MCCWFLCHPEELDKSYILRDRIPSFSSPSSISQPTSDKIKIYALHGKAAIPRALPSFCPSLSCYLSCSRLVTYLKALGTTCLYFLLSPACLQMFQSLTWIPKLTSRWLLMLILKEVLMVRAQQEQGEVEFCHHRNRSMKVEDIPRYLDLKWSHQKSPDLFNLQILYHTKIKNHN